MNIYLLDKSPIKTARMVPEHAQVKRLDDALELASYGAQYWEKEEPGIMVWEPKHAWSHWTTTKYQNWMWVITYLNELIDEFDRRNAPVRENHKAYAHYLNDNYRAPPKIQSIPPRCIPRKYKPERNTIDMCLVAYMRYVRAKPELHAMGGNTPLWVRI